MGSRCLIMNENDVEMVYKIDPLYQITFHFSRSIKSPVRP
jgi:hypothetical protein